MSGYTDQQALNVMAKNQAAFQVLSNATKSTPAHGSQNVASAGTAVAIGTGEGRILAIQAKPGNTGNIYLGDSGVSASSYGVLLTPGESIGIEASVAQKLDLSEHFIDSDNDGDGVTFMYWG